MIWLSAISVSNCAYYVGVIFWILLFTVNEVIEFSYRFDHC